MPTVHPTAWLYLPLFTLNPDGAEKVIKNVEQEVEVLKKSGTLPPGRAEQYDIQLSSLRNRKIADCQIVCFPGYRSKKGILARKPHTAL
jgi:hypothetical protein